MSSPHKQMFFLRFFHHWNATKAINLAGALKVAAEAWLKKLYQEGTFFQLSNMAFESLSTSPRIVCVKEKLWFSSRHPVEKKTLCLTVLDVTDAVLLVPQQETVYVKIPSWIVALSKDGSNAWLLKRCLPGQRTATLCWYDFFANLCRECVSESLLQSEGTKKSPQKAVKKLLLWV